MSLLPQSLIILISLGLPGPLSHRTTSVGIVTFDLLDTENVKDQLYHLNVHRSLGPDGIHPRVLRS